MLLQNENEKRITDKFVVGYELSDKATQISYYQLGKQNPETVSVVARGEQYEIPTVLCKREEVNQWFYGKEALKQEEDGILITDLLQKAKDGNLITVEDQEYDPVELLYLFIKRSLGLLSMIVQREQEDAIMITVSDLDERTINVLKIVAEKLRSTVPNVYFQSHTESFYYYMIHQPAELWNYQVLVCDYSGDELITYRMEMNRKTSPIVTFIDTVSHKESESEKDNWFLGILEQLVKDRIVGAVYLVGRGFEGDWSKKSLRFLCSGRRVFQGNNLYSKGACYGASEKLQESEAGRNHVFLGLDKLKSNIGMRALKKDKEVYVPILDAGTNWFETENELEVYLNEGNELKFVVTPLNGQESYEISLSIFGIAKRPNRTTRLLISACLLQENKLMIAVKDLGFGELFPASKMVWTQEYTL